MAQRQVKTSNRSVGAQAALSFSRCGETSALLEGSVGKD